MLIRVRYTIADLPLPVLVGAGADTLGGEGALIAGAASVGAGAGTIGVRLVGSVSCLRSRKLMTFLAKAELANAKLRSVQYFILPEEWRCA